MTILSDLKWAGAMSQPVIVQTRDGRVYGPNGNTLVGKIKRHKNGVMTITLMDKKTGHGRAVVPLKEIERLDIFH